MLMLRSHLWQLPQNLLGKLVCKLTDAIYTGDTRATDVRVYLAKDQSVKGFGVSLGQYIILTKGHMTDKTILHEYGHCLQSRKLGWLYLLVIGIPSITMNILTRLKVLKAENYYYRWPESWADKLGKVER